MRPVVLGILQHCSLTGLHIYIVYNKICQTVKMDGCHHAKWLQYLYRSHFQSLMCNRPQIKPPIAHGWTADWGRIQYKHDFQQLGSGL